MSFTDKDRETMSAIRTFQRMYYYSPSTNDLREYLQLNSRATITKRLKRLVELKLIELDSRGAVKFPPEVCFEIDTNKFTQVSIPFETYE